MPITFHIFQAINQPTNTQLQYIVPHVAGAYATEHQNINMTWRQRACCHYNVSMWQRQACDWCQPTALKV